MEQKTALVTGASRGIGRAIALRLAEEGYHLCINYHTNKRKAEQTCSEIEKRGGKAIPLQADVGKIAEIDRMFEAFTAEFNHIDLLVNNAGITAYLPFLEATEELWDSITNTDWKGSYFCAQRAARIMVETVTPGCIINITSIHQKANFPISNIYGPTKAALHKFTEHAALELSDYGIRVNAIAPGCTKIRPDEDTGPRGRMLVSRIPSGRYGETDEIAEAVIFLASEKASYITGTCLLIDGGASLPALLDNKYIPDDLYKQFDYHQRKTQTKE
jgi:NAD(P)-dependent dehydrogenase (short-subunit alcohol dehydrogenase family)